jgi:hypothetical protein
MRSPFCNGCGTLWLGFTAFFFFLLIKEPFIHVRNEGMIMFEVTKHTYMGIKMRGRLMRTMSLAYA